MVGILTSKAIKKRTNKKREKKKLKWSLESYKDALRRGGYDPEKCHYDQNDRRKEEEQQKAEQLDAIKELCQHHKMTPEQINTFLAPCMDK